MERWNLENETYDNLLGTEHQSDDITPIVVTPKAKLRNAKKDILKESNKERASAASMRSKRSRTLFKKTAEFIRNTGMEAILIIKDIQGNYSMLGSDTLEKIVLAKKPIIDTNKHVISQYSDLKELTFNNLTEVIGVSPAKTPPSLSFSLPGSSSIQQELIENFLQQKGTSEVVPFNKDTAKIKKPNTKKKNI